MASPSESAKTVRHRQPESVDHVPVPDSKCWFRPCASLMPTIYRAMGLDAASNRYPPDIQHGRHTKRFVPQIRRVFQPAFVCWVPLWCFCFVSLQLRICFCLVCKISCCRCRRCVGVGGPPCMYWVPQGFWVPSPRAVCNFIVTCGHYSHVCIEAGLSSWVGSKSCTRRPVIDDCS
jgi:hypothetical protein